MTGALVISLDFELHWGFRDRMPVEEALPLFVRAYELHPAWRELVPRIVAVGLLPDDPELIDRILGTGR